MFFLMFNATKVMIKLGFLTLYFIFLLAKKTTVYQNAKNNSTLGARHRTWSIYRSYCCVEYTIYSAKVDCIRC